MVFVTGFKTSHMVLQGFKSQQKDGSVRRHPTPPPGTVSGPAKNAVDRTGSFASILVISHFGGQSPVEGLLVRALCPATDPPGRRKVVWHKGGGQK